MSFSLTTNNVTDELHASQPSLDELVHSYSTVKLFPRVTEPKFYHRIDMSLPFVPALRYFTPHLHELIFLSSLWLYFPSGLLLFGHATRIQILTYLLTYLLTYSMVQDII
jgi:hypothetical protein